MGVDFPDGHKLSVIRGWDGSEFRNIKVSSTGELYILLSALYNSTIKSLKCDAQGNAFLNVKAQDLAELINRPKYGAGQRVKGNTLCPNGVYTSLFSVSGKGVTYGGWIRPIGGTPTGADYVRYKVDGSVLTDHYISTYFLGLGWTHWGQPLYVSLYDTTNSIFVVSFSAGITFETSLSIEYKPLGGNVTEEYEIQFALV